MKQANLILTLMFNDETPDALLNIYDEDFSFEYGNQILGNIKGLVAFIRTKADEVTLNNFQEFLTNCHHSISKENNFNKVIINTFRANQDEQQNPFILEGKNIKNFICSYKNLPNQHYIEIIFEII